MNNYPDYYCMRHKDDTNYCIDDICSIYNLIGTDNNDCGIYHNDVKNHNIMINICIECDKFIYCKNDIYTNLCDVCLFDY